MIFDTRAETAIAAAERGDYAGATTTVIDLVAEDWNNTEAHRAWGRVLLEQGKATDAAAAYRTALALDPRRSDVHFDLAEALLAQAEKNPFLPLTNWIEARNAVRDGLELSPGTMRVLALRARVERQRARALSSSE